MAATRWALVCAAEEGDVGEVEWLLDEEGADIEGRDGCGRTALREAAEEGRREVVECLLDRGADIEAWDGGVA
jgi:ankyrin repeat protein